MEEVEEGGGEGSEFRHEYWEENRGGRWVVLVIIKVFCIKESLQGLY